MNIVWLVIVFVVIVLILGRLNLCISKFIILIISVGGCTLINDNSCFVIFIFLIYNI